MYKVICQCSDCYISIVITYFFVEKVEWNNIDKLCYNLTCVIKRISLEKYTGKIERKREMKKRNGKVLSLVVGLALVASLTGPKGGMVVNQENNTKRTELKQYTVSEKKLNEIVEVAKNDGAEAAEMVNQLKGNDFEAAVNKILTEYYENGEAEALEEFEQEVDGAAAEILAGYEEAAFEREQANVLPYEAGVSLLSFGADITEKEIKDIVKDQYGECKYIHKSPDGTYMVKVKNSLGLTVDKATEAYGEYAETTAVASNDRIEQIAQAHEFVNDPFIRDQYYLDNMQVADAWQYVRGVSHSKVKVVVIDGGADLNCVDLRNSSSLSAEILSDGSIIPLSQSSQQYINDHGTYVAGVIAATANNGSQIAGVASCINNDVVELINVKIEMYVDKIALGVDYALNCGAKVVNISLGSARGQHDMERAAIDRFVAAGGTVVCGAGNDGNDAEYYPSDYANTISVMSVDSGYAIAGSSNRGWRKDVCAPGVSIYAPGAGDTTWITHGTSLACPMVTGIVAMMYSVNPGMNSDSVRSILTTTTTDIGEAGRDYTYGYGFVNAYRAVTTAGGGTTEIPTTTVASSGGPQEVFGQIITANTAGIIDVVWGAASNGETYNVYLDGNIATDVNGTTLRNVVCAAYQIPASAGSHTIRITSVLNGQESSGVTDTVTVAGATVEPPTTQAPSTTMPGYTTANANWNNLNYWSVYFAHDWGNDPTGSYKDGGSYNDFGVYVDKASGTAWGIQMKTQVLNTTIGKTYVCKVTATFNSNMTDTITFKDEGTQVAQTYTLVNGTNNFELEFTPTANNTQIFFDLGMLPAGGNFVITSFSLAEKIEETTTEEPTTEEPTTRTFDAYGTIEAEHFVSNEGGVIDINSNASGGYNVGGVANGTTMRYDNVNFSENAGAITICYSSPSGTALGNAEFYVDSLDNKVATVELANNGSSWQEYGVLTANLTNEITAGSHTIYIKYVTTGDMYYVANVDYFRFIKVTEIETPTDEEPTTTVKTIEGGIEIYGFQISAVNKGTRTIYSVDSEIDGKAVVGSGLVYSLADYADESEVYVGSSSKYVCSFASTSKGISSIVYADSDLATSYAMTMKFATNYATEFTANWRVRAYAELSDGSYVYTDCYTYTIYEIADRVYQDCSMNTEEQHNYLYDGILSIVDPGYIKKEFDWNNSMVGV